MLTLMTLGPAGSDCWLAAQRYNPAAEILTCRNLDDLFASFADSASELALVPVYNTREGAKRDARNAIVAAAGLYWVDNVVLPLHLSLFSLPAEIRPVSSAGRYASIHTVVGRDSVLSQCREFLDTTCPDATRMAVNDIEAALARVKKGPGSGVAIVDTEELGRQHGLCLVEREIASHNRTRFAVLARDPAVKTGYDATAIVTLPLKDRVGLLVDILGEFSRRGINIIDLQSENDIKTQKLQIYLEFEGHRDELQVAETLKIIGSSIIGDCDSLKILGSFPRVDMRRKDIRTIGFIGTGAMSHWFAERLRREGYRTLLTGRTSAVTPEEMITRVEVVMVCVPISATAATIRRFGPLLSDGQALIILAGESEQTIAAALETTAEGVEVMFVHNLWGPQAATMKDKNAAIVNTTRSGALCAEIEGFLYKHGADIYQDSASRHDLLMGVGQKLPTTISVALAKTLKEHNLDWMEIAGHSTLTSLYGLLAMVRVHSQNPRTYAEIMSTGGDGRKIVRSFVKNLVTLMEMAEREEIDSLCEVMEKNRATLPVSFVEARMKEAKAVDEILSRPGIRKAR